MPTNAPKDIQYTLKAGTPAFKTVEVLQKRFGVEKTRAGKTTLTKLQGRIILSAFLDTILTRASEDTLIRLAEEIETTTSDDHASKASDFFLAVHDARQQALPTSKKSLEELSINELEAELARRKAAQEAASRTPTVTKV
jgi:hypothetical protein